LISLDCPDPSILGLLTPREFLLAASAMLSRNGVQAKSLNPPTPFTKGGLVRLPLIKEARKDHLCQRGQNVPLS
jgi:hypothetical protein